LEQVVTSPAQSVMSQVESVAHFTLHSAEPPHEMEQSPWQMKSQNELPLQ
jgi:hypothetical protein